MLRLSFVSVVADDVCRVMVSPTHNGATCHPPTCAHNGARLTSWFQIRSDQKASDLSSQPLKPFSPPFLATKTISAKPVKIFSLFCLIRFECDSISLSSYPGQYCFCQLCFRIRWNRNVLHSLAYKLVFDSFFFNPSTLSVGSTKL